MYGNSFLYICSIFLGSSLRDIVLDIKIEGFIFFCDKIFKVFSHSLFGLIKELHDPLEIIT